MTSKTIMIGLVAIAFVAGSILTGTMAYASGDKNGKPFEALWDAIHALETSIADTSTTDDLQSQIDVLELDVVTVLGPEAYAPVNGYARSVVTCPDDYEAIGGNVAKMYSNPGYTAPSGVVFSQPSYPETNGWEVQVHLPSHGTTIFKASVQCALIGP